jgi:hypothetical protein
MIGVVKMLNDSSEKSFCQQRMIASVKQRMIASVKIRQAFQVVIQDVPQVKTFQSKRHSSITSEDENE